MIGYILDPSPWFYPLAFLAGLILIWWNYRQERLSQLAKRITVRHMAFVFIAIGALCLTIGVTILAKQSVSQDVRNAMVAPMPVTERPAPVILTDEEKQFRVALRRFVLSNISELNQSVSIALSVQNNIANDIDNHRSKLTPSEQEKMTDLISMYQELIGVQFFPKFAHIMNASKKNVEDIDQTQLASLIKNFFDGYRNAQMSFKQFIKISELDLTESDLLEKWLSADSRTLNALRDLKSFPAANVLGPVFS